MYSVWVYNFMDMIWRHNSLYVVMIFFFKDVKFLHYSHRMWRIFVHVLLKSELSTGSLLRNAFLLHYLGHHFVRGFTLLGY